MGILATVALVAFVGAGLGIIAYALEERRWLRAFATRGVVTPGVIERVRVHRGVGDRAVDRTTWYRAVVRFRLADGSERRSTTRWPTAAAPPVGAVVPVRFDPDRPRRVVLVDGPGSRPPSTGLYVAVGVLAIVMGWVFSSLLRVFA